MHYLIPKTLCQAEYEIKKSRFIAYAFKAVSREDFLTQLERIKKDYADARHHCWAYLIGDPKGAAMAAMNDDGEPSGTAGKPILKILQHKQVGDVGVVVVRYFGGVKLGAGGLVRAYSTAARLVMDKLELEHYRPMWTTRIEFGFHHEKDIRHWLAQVGGEVLNAKYTECIAFDIAVPLDQQSQWQEIYARLMDEVT